MSKNSQIFENKKIIFKKIKITMGNNKEKIEELEERISTTKYNKKTQKAIGIMKAKLAKLKEAQELSSKKGPTGTGYAVKKSGDATIVLIGFPSVGKSTLLNQLSKQKSRVGAFEFTTLTVVPGLLDYKNAKIQILDIPGIIEGASRGRGRGKEVMSVMRTADLYIIVVDVHDAKNQLEILQKELFNFNIRPDREPPLIKIVKTDRGGIKVHSTVKQELDKDTIKSILREFGIVNGSIVIREKVDIDTLIDGIEKNRVYGPSLVVVNKIDMVDDIKKYTKDMKYDIAISGDKGTNISELKEMIWERLNLMAIYCKEPGKEADMKKPLIIKKGSTVEDVAKKLHREFVKKFRFAKIWGKSAKFPGQKQMLKHKLKENDIVEINVD